MITCQKHSHTAINKPCKECAEEARKESEAEMSRLRVEAARKKVKSGFSYFTIGEKKAVTKVTKDQLSKEDRNRINEIKDRLAYGDEEGDLW